MRRSTAPHGGKCEESAVKAAIRGRLLTAVYAMLMTEHLAYANRREADYPSSPELHERLETIEALSHRARLPAARQMMRQKLTDLRIKTLLTNGDPSIARALNSLLRPMNLPYIGRLAAAARARNPRQHGRHKFYPDPISGPDALEYCALIVRMAWHKDGGQWPGVHNSTAQLICEMLWLSAGGASHRPHCGSDAPGAFATWREHLIAARQYCPPHPAGKLVALILAGDPPKRRPLRTEEQSRRWRAGYVYPRGARRLLIESDPIRSVRRSLIAHLKRRYGLFSL
jgi:hypothetical protein